MAYKALDIAKKLIFKAQEDEANGGEALTNLKLQTLVLSTGISSSFLWHSFV